MTSQARASFILASASPRRKTLLAKAGYLFDVIPSTVDESIPEAAGIGSLEHAKLLALTKAKAVAALYPSKLVLGADTIVDFNGRIIGKPKDADDAEKITRMLFSEPHKVITAAAFVKIDEKIEIIETDTTIVYPRKLTEKQIREHIKNGNWHGKAGAYGIQETGEKFVERIDGSLTNVMGFPMELVNELLKQFVLKS